MRLPIWAFALVFAGSQTAMAGSTTSSSVSVNQSITTGSSTNIRSHTSSSVESNVGTSSSTRVTTSTDGVATSTCSTRGAGRRCEITCSGDTLAVCVEATETRDASCTCMSRRHGAYGDRDGDGVRNRHDARPDNPRRQ